MNALRHWKVGLRLGAIFAAVVSLGGCYQLMASQHQVEDPSSRPWFCSSQLMDGDPGAEHYLNQGIVKGYLSWADCHEVAADFDAALLYALQWPTRGAAEDAGWRATVNYAEGMGTHHTLGNPLAGTFNPQRPTFLQYGGNTRSAKLVGLSWFVENGSDDAPPGFPGDNDWFHVHEYLCISNSTGLVIRDGQCQPGDNGSSVYLGNYWLLHAWIVPSWLHEMDVFVGHHPCLLASGPAAPDDPCWTEHDH